MSSRNECIRRIRVLLKRKLRCVRHPSISMKITGFYAAIFLVLLLLSSMVLAVGIYVSFYHEAEIAIRISKELLAEVMEGSRADFASAFSDELPALPGVIVRVVDEKGNLVYDNDRRFLSIDKMESHELKRTPFWANQGMRIVDLGRLTLYHDVMPIQYEGMTFYVHFFRTIMGGKDFLEHLRWVLLLMMGAFFFVALASGYFMSRRVLSPIRKIAQTARTIEVENLGARIAVPPVRDEVTELAKTFNHMLDRLESGFAQQKRFVSDASHELRTPVTVILGYSDMLARWGRTDEGILEEGIISIRTEAENMQQLIERLLFLARTDQNRQKIQKELVELSELVEDVMRRADVIAKDHQVELLENDEGTVVADPVMLRQMLRIFLDNAVKYTPKGGRVTVSSRREGEVMVLAVADNGIGIADKDQEKIFDRFYRVDSSRTKETGGTGLGLPIAKWICEQHDIDLSLQSRLGEGTTITLRIPLAETGFAGSAAENDEA